MWQIRFDDSIHQTLVAMPDAVTDGRNLKEGYIRGCGVLYGNIPALCRKDPLFAEAFAKFRKRTLLLDVNLFNLYVLLRFYLTALPFGHIAEFGSFRGGSALFMAYVAKRLYPGTKILAFDTFEGMPSTDRQRDAVREGQFAQANLEEIGALAAQEGLDNLVPIKGLFEDTAASALAEHGPVRLAHIDCDIYSGIVTAYEALKPHLVSGGYLVFDDPLQPTCLGALEAVERLLIRRDGLHAEQAYPHLVFRYPPPPEP